MIPWYQQAVFYHMYPLGMTGAPKSNDAAGTRFNELNLWIPHIKSLGCTAVYIGPLFESSTHGYDTKDYKLIDRRLGINDDFISFVSECHMAGIKVVVDGVFNHTGRDFFAFADIRKNKWDSPYKDWYKNIDYNGVSPLGDPFTYESWQGHPTLPALNLSNPSVREYLFDVVRFWSDTFHIDGIRLDCANVLDFGFMEQLRKVAENISPDFWLMGEVIHGDYTRWVNSSTLHSVTNYELHKSLYSGMNDHNFFEIAHNVRRLQSIGGSLYTFLDNHDENRIASKLLNRDHLSVIWTLLFTLPGIPSIYYGDEWGTEGVRSDTSDEVLRPRISPEQFSSKECALTKLILELSHIHTAFPEYHEGTYEELLLTNRQYAFARRYDHEMLITIANNDDQATDISFMLHNCTCAETVFCTESGMQENTKLSVVSGRLEYHIQGNSAVILKAREA